MPTATVVGGGPAGAVAAFALARHAWQVTLVEQHPFPRDKVCGECLSALGIDVLARLGLDQCLLAAGPVRLTHAILHAPDGPGVRLPLPRAMWGLSRRTMDALLLDAARQAGVRIHQPARCQAIHAGAEPRVEVRDLLTNSVACWPSDCVLLADGKAALLEPRPLATGDFGIKAHFTAVDGPRDAIELFGVDGHYGGVAPVEGDCWNAAFSIPAALLEKYRGNLDLLFAATTRQNGALHRRFAAAVRATPWLAAPLPRFGVAPRWMPSVIPLGNAAAALEPIGGEGMGLALRSAELAASALACGGDIEALRRSFDRLWRSRRRAARAAAWVVSRPGISGAALDWARNSDRLAAGILRLIGKAG
jgi:flavin-dependent dehydrogenase